MITADYRIDQGPSTNPDQIRGELMQFPTPLIPFAESIYNFGLQYNVDPGIFMGTVFEENLYGTFRDNIAWDPETETGSYNWASVSNALYGGYPVSGSRWGQYPSIQAGIEAYFRLITAEYYPLGQNTIGSIWWGLDGQCPCPNTCSNPSDCTGRQVCEQGQCSGAHAYGPCFENPCGSIDKVIGVMNRIQAMPIMPPPLPPVLIIPGIPPGANLIGVGLGLAVIAGGIIVAGRSFK